MRLFTSALCASVAVGLLCGCAGSMSGPNSAVPGVGAQSRTGPISVYEDVAPMALTVLHAVAQPEKKKTPKGGIYISSFDGTDIYGYPANNKANKPPTCTVEGVSSPNDIAVDGKGNLIDPDGGTTYVFLFKGPGMCGKNFASIADTYGQPSDASSSDAATGKIAVGNIVDAGSEPGSVSICTAKGGCTVNLTRSEMYHAGGVAMSNGGDCWVSVKTSSSGGAELVYYKGCAGNGAVAKGFKNTYYGGLEIDNKGNLLSIDYTALNLYIYSGCDPTCKLVSGPFALANESFFAKLNEANTQLTMVDRTNGAADVYSYTDTKVKYEYSFDNGLTLSLAPEGVAVNPRSKQ